MKSRIFSFLVYGYLSLPILIFIFGWLKIFWALPLGVAVCAALFVCIREDNVDYGLLFAAENRRILVIAFCIVAMWVYLSGIGGLSFQNEDHRARTTIFHALVEYEWPVISQNGRGLIYYIGWWLPAALLGKVFGFTLGYYFQTVWAIIGVWLVYCFICLSIKKVKIWPLVVLVFFSGMDVLGAWLSGTMTWDAQLIQHWEWWAGYPRFQYSSMTTQLYWVFNQAIPVWLVCSIIFMKGKPCKNFLFLAACLLLSSVFPFIGLLPFVVSIAFQNLHRKEWKNVVNFQNIIGVVIIGGVSSLYLLGNHWSVGIISSVSKYMSNSFGVVLIFGIVSILLIVVCAWIIVKRRKKIRTCFDIEKIGYLMLAIVGVYLGLHFIHMRKQEYTLSSEILKYILFSLVEWGVYVIVLYKFEKKNINFWIMLVMLLICPVCTVGKGGDFCMRASVPALFLLMLCCIRNLEKIRTEKTPIALLIVFLAIGGLTPFSEIHRSLIYTFTPTEELQESNIENEILKSRNFSGEIKDNLFFEHLAR